jgi:hypothetical protein
MSMDENSKRASMPTLPVLGASKLRLLGIWKSDGNDGLHVLCTVSNTHIEAAHMVANYVGSYCVRNGGVVQLAEYSVITDRAEGLEALYVS